MFRLMRAVVTTPLTAMVLASMAWALSGSSAMAQAEGHQGGGIPSHGVGADGYPGGACGRLVRRSGPLGTVPLAQSGPWRQG